MQPAADDQRDHAAEASARAAPSAKAETTNYELRTTNSPALFAHNVSYTYRGDGQETHAVRNVSVELAAGEFVALTGRSG